MLFLVAPCKKEFLQQNRKVWREQLAILILYRSSDSFLLYKQCRSGLTKLWKGVERTNCQAMPSSLSPSDWSTHTPTHTHKHTHMVLGSAQDHIRSLQERHSNHNFQYFTFPSSFFPSLFHFDFMLKFLFSWEHSLFFCTFLTVWISVQL